MLRKFDLVVIGSGTAASTVATQCRSAGWEVAIIDSRPFGGTCALRGCDPKKVLAGAAEVIDWPRRMKERGVRADNARIEWADLMRFKRTFTDSIPDRREQSFARAGISCFHGHAQFVDRATVQVNNATMEGRYVVIATGALPRRRDIPGEQYVTASDQFLSLDKLPRRLVFIGGGYISFEFAHITQRAEGEATILHRGEWPLEAFDHDLVARLVEKTKQLGIKIELGLQARAVEKSRDRFSVRASAANGREQMFDADLVVHGAGRVADVDDLNLDAAGIQAGDRGVKVNEYLQSISNPDIYAAGDAAASGLPPLTPAAGYTGRIVASNLLKGNHRKIEAIAIPTIVFTTPPLAAVGLSEQDAREKKLQFRVNQADTSGWYSARRVGEDCSGFKVLIEEHTDRILGAQVIGPNAEEMINVFGLAIQSEVSASKLKHTIFGYPTVGSDLQYML